jgi:hypothetical protein
MPYTALYPGTIPPYTTIWPYQDDIDWMEVEKWDAMTKELRAIMLTLGVNPHGSYSDVASRLDAIPNISAQTEKTSLNTDDLFLIEDSQASYAKKKVKSSNVGGAGGGGVAVSYVGDGQDNRTVAHGLGRTPIMIAIFYKSGDAGRMWVSGMDANKSNNLSTGSSSSTSIKSVDSTNVTLGTDDAVNYNNYDYVMFCI